MVEGVLSNRVARELPNWHLAGEELVAVYHFSDFATAFAAATRVAFLAERAGHHPDLTIGWGRVEIRITTQSEGRLTELDVDFALETTKALGQPSASPPGQV